eukprot:scaffold7115_cov125-Isochrysis_galbana.AAC.3
MSVCRRTCCAERVSDLWLRALASASSGSGTAPPAPPQPAPDSAPAGRSAAAPMPPAPPVALRSDTRVRKRSSRSETPDSEPPVGHANGRSIFWWRRSAGRERNGTSAVSARSSRAADRAPTRALGMTPAAERPPSGASAACRRGAMAAEYRSQPHKSKCSRSRKPSVAASDGTAAGAPSGRPGRAAAAGGANPLPGGAAPLVAGSTAPAPVAAVMGGGTNSASRSACSASRRAESHRQEPGRPLASPAPSESAEAALAPAKARGAARPQKKKKPSEAASPLNRRPLRSARALARALRTPHAPGPCTQTAGRRRSQRAGGPQSQRRWLRPAADGPRRSLHLVAPRAAAHPAWPRPCAVTSDREFRPPMRGATGARPHLQKRHCRVSALSRHLSICAPSALKHGCRRGPRATSPAPTGPLPCRRPARARLGQSRVPASPPATRAVRRYTCPANPCAPPNPQNLCDARPPRG